MVDGFCFHANEKAKTVQDHPIDGGTAASPDRQAAPLDGLAEVRAVKRPPVHLWHPPFCGDIDMRIAADGTWHYLGGPITRMPLVKLFASILRKDEDRYVLVTPVEMVGITVEDAPFIATTMQVEGEGPALALRFTSNVGDEAQAGVDHPLRFERQDNGGYKPYVMMRDGLWAKLTRTLYADLVALGAVEARDDGRKFGIWSGGVFFAMAPESDLALDE